MTNTYKILNVTVGTVKKSTETSSAEWFSRNALHVWEGGFRFRIMYFPNGSVAGYRAGAYFDRESERGVVVLRNVTGGDVDLTELALSILQLTL